MLIHLTLPWPPSANHYWRNIVIGRSARTVISKPGREYKDDVAEIVRAEAADKKLSCRLSVVIEAFPPDRRRRDLDNLNKSLLDAMEGAGVYENDSLIDDLRLIRREVVGKPGRVEVSISELVV